MSLTQLGADLLWNPGSVTAEQVRSSGRGRAAIVAISEVKRDVCVRLQAVVLALKEAHAAMDRVAKDVHELAWRVDNGDVASFKMSEEGK